MKKDKLCRIAYLERIAIEQYIEDIDFNLILECLRDEELEEYKQLIKEVYLE